MRTTVSIDDQLLGWAKERAKQDGVTLGGVVEAALRRHLSAESGRVGPALATYRGSGDVVAGVDLRSNRSLLDAVDEDRPDR